MQERLQELLVSVEVMICCDALNAFLIVTWDQQVPEAVAHSESMSKTTHLAAPRSHVRVVDQVLEVSQPG